ncbi:hypothetical protein GGR51DRAFT_563622 [Nemania sp. FL0031]|nr:hypothetical protein GGR51DRAFT_563622 [Nemania sp. FL0031]
MMNPNSPFQTRLFQSSLSLPKYRDTDSSDIFPWEYFPVSFRTGPSSENIHAVSGETVSHFLEVEFSLKRLDAISTRFWRRAYPAPPMSLNTHVQLGRRVVPTNALNMHLVSESGKIFLKPVPRYLLEPEFWAAYLPPSAQAAAGRAGGSRAANKAQETAPGKSVSDRAVSSTGVSSPPQPGIRESALGLLYTYACLISHPADLKLALDHGLIPKGAENEPDWATWRRLAVELLHPDISSQVQRHFWPRELRLHMPNWIYVFKNTVSFQRYYNQWSTYTEFFTSNIPWIAGAAVFILALPTTMQGGPSTNSLNDDEVFNDASDDSTFFTISVFVIMTLAMMFVFFLAAIKDMIDSEVFA